VKLRGRPAFIALASALLGAAGCLVVFNLLPEPQELREPLPHRLASSNQQLKTSMGALFGSNYIPGNKVDTLVNGDQIFPAMLRAIRDARQTISFETYIYWRGDIAEEFADALSAKARDGLVDHCQMTSNATPDDRHLFGRLLGRDTLGSSC